jgi:predicted AAA+ superfamily ATPase
LIDAGIIHKVSRVKEIRMPLKFYEDFSAFKLFLLDCGLLGCLVNAPARQMLVGDNVFKEFKGAFTEQFVLQQLTSMGILPYYWSNDKTSAEVDFAIQSQDRVIPVEVKAEENVKSRSLSEYIKGNKDLKGLRISMLGYKDQGWMENIPLYGLSKYIRALNV